MKFGAATTSSIGMTLKNIPMIRSLPARILTTHIPPDIKHHRIPAPGLPFDQPNLTYLIEEIITNPLK